MRRHSSTRSSPLNGWRRCSGAVRATQAHNAGNGGRKFVSRQWPPLCYLYAQRSVVLSSTAPAASARTRARRRRLISVSRGRGRTREKWARRSTKSTNARGTKVRNGRKHSPRGECAVYSRSAGTRTLFHGSPDSLPAICLRFTPTRD